MHKIRRHLLVAAAAAVAVSAPALAIASDDFTDVATGDFFHDAVGLIHDAGVTAGCSATLYCPNDPVTRGQMAVFLAKLGGLGANPPVAEALTAETADHALDSDTVGSYEPSDLTRAAGTTAGACGGTPFFDCAEIDALDYSGSPLMTVDIDAPVDGALLVAWTLNLATDDLGAGADNCAAVASFVDGQQVGPVTSGFLGPIFYDVRGCVAASGVGSPNDEFETLASTLLVPVPAGTHTVDVRGVARSGDPDHDGASMTVTFHPFDGDGVPPFEPTF